MTTPLPILTPSLILPNTMGVPSVPSEHFSILENLTPKDLIRPGRFKGCAIDYLHSHATPQKSNLEWKAIWDNTLKYLLNKGWTGYFLECLMNEFFFNAPLESRIGLFNSIRDFDASLSLAISDLELIKLFWNGDWHTLKTILKPNPRLNNFQRQILIICEVEFGRMRGELENTEKAKSYLTPILRDLGSIRATSFTKLFFDFEKFNTSLGHGSLIHSFPVLCNFYFAKNNFPLTHHSLSLYSVVLANTATLQINSQATENQNINTRQILPPQLPSLNTPEPNSVKPLPLIPSLPTSSNSFAQNQIGAPIPSVLLQKPTLEYPLTFDPHCINSLKRALPNLTCDNLREALPKHLQDLCGHHNYLELGFEEIAKDFWILLHSHFIHSSDYQKYYTILRELGPQLTKFPKIFLALFKTLLFRDDTDKIKFLFSEDVNIQNFLTFYWHSQLDQLALHMESVPVDERSLEHFNFWLLGVIFNDKDKWKSYPLSSRQTLIKKYQLKRPLTSKQVKLIERFCASPEKLGCYTKKQDFEQITALIPFLASWGYYIQQHKKFDYLPPFNFVVGVEIAGAFATLSNKQGDYLAIKAKLSEAFPVSNKRKK